MIPREAGFCQQRQMAGDSGEAVFKALKEAGHHPRSLPSYSVIQSEPEARMSSTLTVTVFYPQWRYL